TELYDDRGTLLASSDGVTDMRALPAAVYYLRVTATTAVPVPIVIEAKAPPAGQVDPSYDGDVIHGGDGDDLLIGNAAIDQLSGDSGQDAFLGESLEVVDRRVGEMRIDPPTSQRSNIPATDQDPVVTIADHQLELAIAHALGL